MFREREGKNIDVQEKHRLVASPMPPTGALACNPDMCPGRGSHQQPFVLKEDAGCSEPHQSGCDPVFSHKGIYTGD